ncbi:HNH endonuclease, partial [Halogeometricum sp. S1BR25-6]
AELTASTYETVSYARAVDPEFRATVLSRYGATCPISGVDHAGLLDVAHVLPWSEYPDHRADLANVLPLSKIHHAAFDRELFTIDADYRLRINPSFETQSDVLRHTIVDQAGERIPLPNGGVDPGYFEQRNSALDWL